ncbi:MAG TPA: hypothetical protein VN982_01620 [Candidatus Dormibacteraeota bacterium]|nr:hypothetical protein [Candidatus Dormibacteraeota bacterium]
MSEQFEARLAAVEAQVAGLETKLKEEVDRLYNAVFPELDEEILKIRKLVLDDANHVYDLSRRLVEETGERVHKVEASVSTKLQSTIDDAKVLESKSSKIIQETVDKLIAASSSEVVAKALLRALTSTIIKTRPATREEIKSGNDVLVVRQVTPQELRK